MYPTLRFEKHNFSEVLGLHLWLNLIYNLVQRMFLGTYSKYQGGIPQIFRSPYGDLRDRGFGNVTYKQVSKLKEITSQD